MRSRWGDPQRGSVTAEFAALLPAVLLLLGCCLGAVQVVGQQVRLADAAGSAARLLARGEGSGAAAGLVSGLGLNATLTVQHQGEFVCAQLRAVSAFGPFAAAGLTFGARSCALAGGP